MPTGIEQLISGKQLILMTDASFRSAGYALMIENSPDQIIQTKNKLARLSLLDAKLFPPRNSRCQFTKKKLAIYMAILEFAEFLWEISKLTIVLTDNKSVTRFFQTKAIPPPLWNAYDYVLQFNVELAHVVDSVNTVADFPSSLGLKVTEKIHLKIREDVQITPIEATTSSSDVANEEQFFVSQVDGEDETEEQIYQRKEQSRKKATEWLANQEPSSMKPGIKQFTNKHNVVFHERNPGKRTNKSGARC